MTERPAELIVTGGPVHTGGSHGRAAAFAVRDGHIVAVDDVERVRGPRTEVLDLAGRLAMPGLIDGHLHLGIGGTQLAFELPLAPDDGPDEVLAKVDDWAGRWPSGEWVVGGILGSGTFAAFDSADMLRRLDAVSHGHPVLLRDDTMHNRLVNSAALAVMGVDEHTPDPPGGTYARTASGQLTGGLWERASVRAEEAATAAQSDPDGRLRSAVREALGLLTRLGYTAVQEAATMEPDLAALHALERAGELPAWVVASMPMHEFIGSGIVGDELFARGRQYRGELLRPDFVKFAIDGVPTTRTTALLTPYRCHHAGEDPEFRGEPYWSLEALADGLRRCGQLGLGAKIHATGDASVRRALDATEVVRRELGERSPVVQIAHPSFIAPEDVPRFAELDVHADACPFLWHPSPLFDAVADQVPDAAMERIWPLRDLLTSGALVAGGSDWPVGLPELNPWLGIETMVTRSAPKESGDRRTVNPGQAITREQAIAAFTTAPAASLGLDRVTGRLEPGMSADFVVLDRNVFEIPADEIHTVTVEETYFRGRPV